MWAAARRDLGLTDRQFLAIAPVALHALFERERVRDRKADYRAAMVCASLYNVNNDWKKNPEGWFPQDFMPGAKLRSSSGGPPSEEFVRWTEDGGDPDPAWEEDCLRSLNRFSAQVDAIKRRAPNVQWQ